MENVDENNEDLNDKIKSQSQEDNLKAQSQVKFPDHHK